MHEDVLRIRNARRARGLALLGGLTLEAVIFGLLLAASPTLGPASELSPVPAEITCELMPSESEPAV